VYDGERVVPVMLPPGRHVVRIQYTFDDDSHAIVRPKGPYATFRFTSIGPDGKPGEPVPTAAPRARFRAAAVMLDLLAVGVSLLLLSMYVWLLRRELPAASVVVCTFAAIGVSAQVFGMTVRLGARFVIWSLLAVVLGRNRSTRLLLAYIVLLFLGTRIALGAYPRLSTVVYRSGGDDWLSYESFARTILETRSLEGGENVFYLQPLFR
jgi:hypothetical protein